jgi:hypothetical protein
MQKIQKKKRKKEEEEENECLDSQKNIKKSW